MPLLLRLFLLLQIAVTVGLVLAMQAQSRRVAQRGRAVDISASDPELWARLQQDMRDSILISTLREQELQKEAEERQQQPPLLSSPAASAPQRVERVYNIEGRERRVSFVNTDPAVWAAKLAANREKKATVLPQSADTAQQRPA